MEKSGRILIIENCKKYKAGTILDSRDNTVSKESFVYLDESLNRQDEEKVRKIVREALKRLFWRLYTRQAFLVQ